MPRESFCLLVAAAGLAAVAGGCGKNAPRPTEKAEAAIDKALDAWLRGEPPGTVTAGEPPVQATDPDWQAGHRLLSFLVVESKAIPDNPDHVRCRVALSLQDATGKQVDKEVVYDVQLGDTIVIRREGG